jgi:TonB family protein
MDKIASPGDWVGSLIDQRFPLFEWLGSSESGELFRTELPGPQTRKAAIRLVPAEVEDAQAQFDDWAQAEGLSHPHLLRIFESGRGRIDENEFLYVVMELPDEALAHILPTRALSSTEVGDMLPPVLDALAYLHSQGLVHGHLNPANILAVDDRLKLSADKLQQTGRLRKIEGGPRIYDAPESAHGDLTPASDVWSLGVALVEALTQLPPIWSTDRGGDPIIPPFVPEPFAAIARKCLRVDPAARASLAELEVVLHPPAVRAAPVPAPEPAAAAPEPRDAPAPAPPPAPAQAPIAPKVVAMPKAEAPPAPKSPRPGTQQPAFAFTPAPPRHPMQTAGGTVPRAKMSMPVIVGAVALLVVIITAVVMRSHKPQPEPAPPVGETQSAPAPAAARVPASNPAPHAPAPTASQAAPEASPQATPQAPPQAAPQAAAPAPQQTAAPAPAPVAAPSNAGGAASVKGEVAERVMPDVLPKASHTIQGKVTVRVRLQVDANGDVSDASFDSEGPSHYFSNLAMQSARKWRFEPARIGGNPAPSEWALRYEFRRDNTDVTPVEVKP